MLPELDWLMIGTFLGVTLLTGVSLVLLWGRDTDISRRLDELRDPRDAALRSRFQRSRRRLLKDTLKGTLAGLGSRLMPAQSMDQGKVVQQFMHAGIYSPAGPSVYAGIRFVVGVALPIAFGLAAGARLMPPYTALSLAGICGLAGLLGTSVWLRSRVAWRQRRLRTSLPDFLDLMVACLGAGQSFEAALARVTEELRAAHSALALELMIVQREMTLGSPPARALRAFAERSGIDSVRQMATFVEQAQRFGASMTESLRIHAELLRQQRTRRAETLAHQAGVKILLPTLLFIFPPVLVILVGPAAIDLYEKFLQDSPQSASSREA